MTKLHPDEIMQKYKDFQPTGFDCKGLSGDRLGINNWYVLPVSQNRDSGVLTRCNFEVAREMLGEENEETYLVLSFNHWANGWFEIIVINPESQETLDKAEEIIASLENYPILDEMKYSEMEHDEIMDYWEHMSLSERIEYIKQAEGFILDARFDYIKNDRVYDIIRDSLEIF